MPVDIKNNEDEPLLRPSGKIAADIGFSYIPAERMRRKIVQYDELKDVIEATAKQQESDNTIQSLVNFNQVLRPIAESYSEKESYILALDDLL